MLCLLLLCVAACRGDERYCKLGATHVVAHTRHKLIDDVAIVALGQGALLVWSDAGGTYAQRVDGKVRALGQAQRILPRCDGGLALAQDRDAWRPVLACSRRARPGDAEQPGSAELHALQVPRDPSSALSSQPLAMFGPVGTLSEGIALARSDEGFGYAFHDASPDAHRVWFVPRIDPSDSHPILVSDPARMAFSPSLVRHRGALVLAFSERFTRGEDVQTVLRVQEGGAKPIELHARAHLSPMPQLLALGERLLIAYRGAPTKQRKPGLYVAPLERTGRTLRMLDPVRVGRAEGPGHPSLQACLSGFVAATPRSYSGDYFVGLNWLSPTLARPRREQQFYEDARAFTQAAVACLPNENGEQALIALAELPQLDREEAGLHVATYACE